jgi:hypothetical protein
MDENATPSFSSPELSDILCRTTVVSHVFSLRMLFSASTTRASPWLDLAVGRLRLDRLSRNGAGSTFFPWASPIPREPRKSLRRHPSLSLRPASGCVVDRLRPTIAIEATVVAGSKTSKEK